MHRPIVAPGLVCLVVSACSNPLPFGPGRVEVAVETVGVQRVTRGVLLPRSDPEWRNRATNVIRFDLSSRADLVRYFADWDRQVQTRCSVYGAEDGRSYTGFAVGSLQEGIDISMRGTRTNETAHLAPDSTGHYRYTVYAFLDLTADDEEYVDGKPRGTFDLASQRFSSVGCFIVGVAKAPVIFPKTSTFYASERQVKDGNPSVAEGAVQQAPAADVRKASRN